mgnify:CR=1 FL=1
MAMASADDVLSRGLPQTSRMSHLLRVVKIGCRSMFELKCNTLLCLSLSTQRF